MADWNSGWVDTQRWLCEKPQRSFFTIIEMQSVGIIEGRSDQRE